MAAQVKTMRRTAIKRQPWTKDAAARRQATLALQRQARRDLTAHARQLAQQQEPPSPSGDAMDVDSQRSKRRTREDRVKQRRAHFSNQLMTPEWLIDVPRDLNGSGSELGAGWYVLPRPEGKRCLVVANGGNTVARIPSGSVLKKFPSALPSGSHKTNKSSDGYCILDCIFQEQDGTFYVLDVMCWKGYLLYNCTTEFRLYWLRDKLSEGATATVTPANPFRFLVGEALYTFSSTRRRTNPVAMVCSLFLATRATQQASQRRTRQRSRFSSEYRAERVLVLSPRSLTARSLGSR